MIMKNTSRSKSKAKTPDDLKPEYRLHYGAAKPNRFAGQMRKGSLAVLLEPDVARFFKDGESVNAVLRALISAMPARRPSRTP